MMNEIEKILKNLVFISENEERAEYYANFLEIFNENSFEMIKNKIPEIRRNFAGFMAYAEYNDEEYALLKKLFLHLEEIENLIRK